MRSCGDAPSGVLQSASHRDPVPPSLPRVHTPKQRPKRPQSTERAARRGSVPPGKCLRAPSGVQPACLALTAEDQREAARTRKLQLPLDFQNKTCGPNPPVYVNWGWGWGVLKVLFAVTLCRISLSPPGGSVSKNIFYCRFNFFFLSFSSGKAAAVRVSLTVRTSTAQLHLSRLTFVTALTHTHTHRMPYLTLMCEADSCSTY